MTVFAELSEQDLRLLDELLDAYLDLPETERKHWLETLIAQQPTLAPALFRMVAADTPHVDAHHRDPNLDAKMALESNPSTKLSNGTRVGSWQIAHWYASGGSSDVYRAERADGAFERTVAIKLLNQPSAGWQTRFAREQHLLAKLSHPNIVSVLDAGRFESQAYLVMPWMQGQSLAEFTRASDWRTRVSAAIEICDAVAHAHQRLVIHRDLKPSNIVFVDSHPMVLDFGVAKLLDGDMQSTQNFFTPSYASPEQLLGSELSVACDIHGIGLLLYELLSGRPAFPRAQLGLAHAVDAIVHQMPPALFAATAGLQGSQDTQHLIRAIPRTARRDLQAIVSCALAKLPELRYLSAAQLSSDLRAVLAGQMISVRKHSTLSSVLYWVRRNRIATAAAAVAVCASVLGFASYVEQNRRIAAERESALMQVKRLESLREHFGLILREGVAQQGLGAKAALDESVRNLSKLYQDQPQLRAEVLASLGELYVSAGDYLAAQSALAPLAKNTPEFAALPSQLQSKTLESLTVSALRLGDQNAAARWLDQWQAITEPGTANFAEWQIAKATWLRQTGDASAALQMQLDAVTQLFFAPDAAPLAQGIARANLGTSLFQAGRFTDAKLQYQSALAHWQTFGLERNDNVRTAETNLAHILFLEGDVIAASQRYQRLHTELSERGARTPSFAALLIALGRTEALLGDTFLALKQVQEAREILVEKTGASGPDALGAWLNEIDVLQQLVASDLVATVDLKASLSQAMQAATSIATKLPTAHPLRARYAVTQARQLQQKGELKAAAQSYQQAAIDLRSAPASMLPVQWRIQLYLAEIAIAEQNLAAAKTHVQAAQTLVISLQSAAGLDFKELAAWSACIGNVAHAKDALAEFASTISPAHPRVLAIKLCLQSKR